MTPLPPATPFLKPHEFESPRASFVRLHLLDDYFAENRNTVSEWKTSFGFSRVLGKLG